MKNEEEILRAARLRFNSARKADKGERLNADDDNRFAINDKGCQWDDDTRKVRENQNPARPCLVMNKIPEKIDQAEGEFRQLKPSIKVKAVDNKADPKIAEIMGGILRHIEYNSMARVAYNTAHSSVLMCGRGAWRINIVDSEEDPFEQDIVIDRVPNVLSITWDQASKKIDKSDADFMFISEDMLIKNFEDEYPDVSLEGWPDEDSFKGWKTDDTIRICEYWWREDIKVDVFRVMRNGNQVTVWEEQKGDKVIDTKKVKSKKVKWCKMVGNKILDGPFDDYPGKYIPIILEFGKETNIGGVSKYRGMVRFGKEPQRMYNYWTSSEAEQIALAPKVPYMMTAKMLGPHKTQWDQANVKNFPYLLYDADPKFPQGYPKREAPPQISSAMIAAKQGMDHDIMSAMNVYRASLGDEGSEVSGKAILARQRQGSIGGYAYTDNFEFALIHSAKVLLDLIPHVYDTERIIRIRGEGDTEHVVPINARPGIVPQDTEQDYIAESEEGYINDMTVGKYDVVATIGPGYTTQREEALETLVKILETMPKLAEITPDLVISLLDMPMSDELMKRAKKIVPPGIRTLDPDEEPPEDPGPTPEQMIKMKETEIKYMDQLRKDFETQVNGILTVAKAESEEIGRQFEQYKSQMEQLKAEMGQQSPGER